MRISDWSSDVCSSDLPRPPRSGCPQTTQGASPPGTACCAPLLPVLPPRYALHTKRVWTRRCSHPAHIRIRSEEHTTELQSLMRISYAVFCLKKKKPNHSAPNNSTNSPNIHRHTN